MTSVVAAVYYLRIVKLIYFDEPAVTFDKSVPVLRAVLIVTGILVTFLFAYPAPVIDAASAAAKSLF